METIKIKTTKIVQNNGQIEGLPANPREWTQTDIDRLARSIEETPELLEARGLIVYEHGGRYVVLGGNLRLAACRALKMQEVPCIVLPAETSPDKLKEIVIKDNGSFGSWDSELLGVEWDDLPLVDWGVPSWNFDTVRNDQGAEAGSGSGVTDAEEAARKKKEFEERIAAGELDEGDEEYQKFLEKFVPKKTTDDCYTPDIVYDAVADWVAKEYGLNRANFVRPFYPGGDYQKEKYKPTDVIVDNPPFSILSEIVGFYVSKGLRFFLFAPHLTLFSSSSCAALPTGVTITYENGAVVNTSFLTNLEPRAVQLRSAPSLYRAVSEADAANQRALKRELPKYTYPDSLITSALVHKFSRYGIDFVVPRSKCVHIRALDAQKEAGKAVYGSGYLVADDVAAERAAAERAAAERAAAERAAAERAAAERAAATKWQLSDRERKMIEELSRAQHTNEYETE